MQKLHDICTVEGCERPHKARGYCQTHYMQAMRGAPLTPVISARVREKAAHCAAENCTSPVKTKGYCAMHYARWLRHGSTEHRPRWKVSRGGCVYPGCENHVYSNGLCSAHYQKDRKWRDQGLTALGYHALAEKQGFVCAVCEQPERSTVPHEHHKTRDLAVDHCHEKGHVRGLLCSHCNRGLGLFNDDPSLLEKAAAYLRENAVPKVP